MAMKCKNIKNLLYFYSTGEISSVEKNAVEEHLQECRDCSGKLDNIKETLSIVDKYKPGPSLDSRYFDNFTAETLQKIRSSEQKRPSYRFAGFYLKPALALLVFLVIIFTANQIAYRKEIAIVSNLEIAQNMELYQNMELIENIDEINEIQNI